MINPHIVAVGPAQLLQPLLECREAYLVVLIVHGQGREHADAPHPLALLCARREWPRSRAAEQFDEIASPHVPPSARGSHPTTSLEGLCITAKLIVEWQRWVKTGKAHNEQNISGLPPIADIARQFLEQVGGRPVD
jgi:hypothetical protein